MPAGQKSSADRTDDEGHLALKLELLEAFRRVLEISGAVNQTTLAKTLGINQSDVSRLLNGNPSKFSVSRIMTMLTKLGYDVTIGVRPAQGDIGTIKVITEI